MEMKLQKKPMPLSQSRSPKEKGGSGSVFPAKRRSVKTMVFASVCTSLPPFSAPPVPEEEVFHNPKFQMANNASCRSSHNSLIRHRPLINGSVGNLV